MGSRGLLIGALEVSQSPDTLQAIVQVVLQPVGGAMPHTHGAILRPYTAPEMLAAIVNRWSQLGNSLSTPIVNRW